MPDKKKDKKQTEENTALPSGSYVFPNGDKYEGEYLVNDNVMERSGNGVHITADGVRYEGQWASDKMNGRGCITFPSGAKYEGEFVNNKFHGKGVYTWPNGSFYIGDFVENKLLGSGEFRDTEGQVWLGNFRYRAAPGLMFKLEMA